MTVSGARAADRRLVDGGVIDYRVADRVATITLNRPEALNALDGEAKTGLLAALKRAAVDPGVRAVVLTGAGRSFCAGQDLRERLDPAASPLDEEVRDRYNPLIWAIRALPQPSIAAVNGAAAGAGVGLALACDLRIAADDARFVLAFGRLGLVPDSGTSWLLPRVVGAGRAAELLLVGDPLDAASAERIGLVNRVVPAAQLLDEAHALAVRLAGGSPLAMALTKQLLADAADATLDDALAAEAEFQGRAGRSPGHAEGLAAFVEKRPPSFPDRSEAD